MTAPMKLVNGQLVPLTAAELADYNARLANPPTPAAAPVITYKKTMWSRCTLAECEALEAALDRVDAQSRQIFAGATYIDHADPLFTSLRQIIVSTMVATGMAQAAAEARADVILAEG